MRYAIFLYGTQADYGTSMTFSVLENAKSFASASTAQAESNAPGYTYWATVIDTKTGSILNYRNGSLV